LKRISVQQQIDEYASNAMFLFASLSEVHRIGSTEPEITYVRLIGRVVVEHHQRLNISGPKRLVRSKCNPFSAILGFR
jgi:hypothetical protein